MTAKFYLRATVALIAALAAASAPLVAQAQHGKVANLKVSAEVIANCLVSTTDVVFGQYDPVGTNKAAPLDAAGSITLACTQGTLARILLNTGQNSAAGARRMANGAARLGYELYLDAARNSVWNNNFAFTGGAAPSTAPRSQPVYGRVPAGQDVPAGSYADTVLVTVSF